LINRQHKPDDVQALREAYRTSERLFAKLQAFQHALSPKKIRDDSPDYEVDDSLPF